MPRPTAVLAAFVLMAAALPAWAFEAYDPKAFAAAQDKGQPILVHVHAPWCPTCRAQEPTVSALEAERPDLLVFRVDFDGQKDAVRQFRATSQSTLIAFSGKTETGRAVGITDPGAIRALVPARAR